MNSQAPRSDYDGAMAAVPCRVLLCLGLVFFGEQASPGPLDEVRGKVLGRDRVDWMAWFDEEAEVPAEVVFALARFGEGAVGPLAERLATGTLLQQTAALEALSLMGRQSASARALVWATLESKDARLVRNARLGVRLLGADTEPRPLPRARDEGPFDAWLAERASVEEPFTPIEVVEDPALAGGSGWYTHWPGRVMHPIGPTSLWPPEVVRRADGTVEVFLHWNTATLRCERIEGGYAMTREGPEGRLCGGRAVLRFPGGKPDSATVAVWMRAEDGDYARIGTADGVEIGGVVRMRAAPSRAGSRPIAFELLAARGETPLFWARGFVEVP